MDIKKICFVLPEGLPVPAVKGGAIETLIEDIIIINEEKKEFLFTIICVNDIEAKEEAKKYKYTKFINIGPFKCTRTYRIKSIICRAINKIFKVKIPLLKKYDKCVEQYLINNGEKFDLIINESSNFYGFKNVSNALGKEKIMAHLHCYVRADKYLDSTYGNIITVSDYIKNKWMETSKMNTDNVLVLKNGIDLSKFNKSVDEYEKKELKDKLKLSDDDFIVMYCGRIVPEKGIKELMEAIIAIRNTNIKLLILGSPKFGIKCSSNYLNYVNKIVGENMNRIIFTGFLDNKLLYKYYSIANISVIPSIYEDPAPLVPIECMAAGKASIVTNSGGAWEYVNDKCSIKVDKEGDLVNQLKEKIVYLMNNPDDIRKMEEEAVITSKIHNNYNFYENFKSIAYKVIEK